MFKEPSMVTLKTVFFEAVAEPLGRRFLALSCLAGLQAPS